jgi:hypothetical protein
LTDADAGTRPDGGLLAAAASIVRQAAARDPWLMGLRQAGIGWATVELERAAGELAEAFRRAGLPDPRWSPGARDELLGASTWVSREWRDPGPITRSDTPKAVVLLEPDTEGRLAATLARFGEGVGVTYLAPRPDGPASDPARLGRRAAGPLGHGRLVLSRPPWGPNIVVLDR